MTEKPTYEQLESRMQALEKEAANCKRMQAALREAQDFSSAVLATLGALVIVLDTEGRIVQFNRACERLTGYTAAEVLGRVFWDLLLPPEEVDAVKTVFARLRSGAFPNEYENDWMTKDGARLRIMWSNTALTNADGAVQFIIGTGIDITGRKVAEKALRESEDRYRRIAEAVTDYVYTVVIEDGRPVRTIHRPGCEAVTGFAPRDFNANPYLWIQMVPEGDRQVVEIQAKKLLVGGRPEPIEHRIIRKDGVARWVKNTAVPNFDEKGRLRSYEGLVQDITERKEAEEALRESEANYRLLFSASSDAILILDGESKEIVDANEAALALYGYPRTEFLGLQATEISSEPEKSGARIELVASGEPAFLSAGPFQRIHRKRDGTTFPVEVSFGVYRLRDRKFVCAVIRDITERKQMEDALKASVDQLEVQLKGQTTALVQATEDLKREIEERKEAEVGLLESEEKLYEEEKRLERLRFANDVALNLMHEIRNPLVAIGGFSRRLAGSDCGEDKLKEYTRTIFEESMRLERVLDRVLSQLKTTAAQVGTSK